MLKTQQLVYALGCHIDNLIDSFQQRHLGDVQLQSYRQDQPYAAIATVEGYLLNTEGQGRR
jgi:hypothetical protein